MGRKFLGGIAVAAVAGIAVAGCSPVKMGAAAIVGSQRITLATLDTESGQLATAAKQYNGAFQLTQQQVTQLTLTWLIRFKIADELASSSGITITPAQSASAKTWLTSCTAQQAQAQGTAAVPLDELLTANGIAPNLTPDLYRYQAIQNQYLANASGGKAPTCQGASATADAAFTRAQCVTAKSLNIKVNPQFGQLDYSKYQVVDAPDTVSRPGGAAPSASSSAAAPAC